MDGLTEKQRTFAEEYIVDFNGGRAAIAAGYSENGASAAASRLLTYPEVQALIIKAKSARSKRTGIDADWLLTRLADEAQADLRDIYNDDGSLKSIGDWPDVWRKGLVAGIETLTIDGESRITKVKLSDRVKRLELIGKHIDVGAFNPDQKNTNVQINLHVNRPG